MGMLDLTDNSKPCGQFPHSDNSGPRPCGVPVPLGEVAAVGGEVYRSGRCPGRYCGDGVFTNDRVRVSIKKVE